MPPASKPKPNQPCPCGSGKKYRECHALKDERRRRFGRQFRKLLVWVGALAAIALVVYGLSSGVGVAYDEERIGAVNFSGLNASQKKVALRAANAARCTCGCGMTLAQCVSTDSTCPIRTDNIARIKGMVADAME
jgi:SEC-C motif